jgi:NifU-like protein involved in Fe-S cluster formation
VEHYENPRNVGSLDKNDDNVGTVSRGLCCWGVFALGIQSGSSPCDEQPA